MNDGVMQTIFGLHGIARGGSTHLQSKQHGPHNPQQSVVPLRAQSTQPFMVSDKDIPTNNGAVLNILQIIRAVMSSAAEAELGTHFINEKIAAAMRHTLKELGHPQPQTLVQTDKKNGERPTHQ